MNEADRLKRSQFNGVVSIDAKQVDYAWLAERLVTLYDATGGNHWLERTRLRSCRFAWRLTSSPFPPLHYCFQFLYPLVSATLTLRCCVLFSHRVLDMKNQFLCFLLLFFATPLWANKEPVEVVSYYIPGLVNEDKTGSLVDMLKKVDEYSGIDFQLKLMPTKRVQKAFSQGLFLGYFPELEEHRVGESCRTANIMQKKIIVFTRQDSPEITSVSQLEGLKVGAVAGYSYGNEIVKNDKIKIEYVKNDDINVKKLLAGRLDVVVGDVHSTVNAVNQSEGKDRLRYDPETPISSLDVFFLFKNNKQGQQLCDDISVALERLRSEGALKTWFDYE